MRRTKEDAAKTREQILSAALECFDKQGYEKTSLSDIAKVAGLTRGAIYWHFKNKADVFRVIAEQHLSSISQDIESTLHDGHTWQHISAFLQHFFRQLHDNPERACFYRLMDQRGETYTPLLIDIDRKYCALWYDLCQRAIILGKQEGDIHPDTDPECAHILIRAMMIGLLAIHLHYPHYPNLMRHTDHIIKSHIALLRQPLP